MNFKELTKLTLTAITFAAATLNPAHAEHKFYVDFDSIIDTYEATPDAMGLPPADEIYDYSPDQRTFILDYLNTHYEMYGMKFLEGPKPIAFVDSDITLNKSFGAGSEGVDFRNENEDDGAFANTISIFKFLGEDSWTDDDVAMGTANLVGHEAAHLMGVRHHDAWGPIGTGIGTIPSDFTPTFPGPVGAPETPSTFASLHFGGSLSFEGLTTPKVVSERTAVRLEVTKPFSDDLIIEDDGDNNTFDSPQPTGPTEFTTPYPFRPLPDPEDLPEGEDLPIFPIAIEGYIQVITGTIDTPAAFGDGFASEYYDFDGVAGDVWTIEAMSYILEGKERYPDNADVAIALLDATTGAVTPYHAGTALTDDDDDSDDEFLGATLFDIVLPYTGTYVLEVLVAAPFIAGDDTKTGTDGGSYEIFMYSAKPVTIPEPSSALLLLGLASTLTFKRRKHN